MRRVGAPYTPGVQPPPGPISLDALRAAIPRHCFTPSNLRSLAYVAIDLAVLGALFALSAQTDSLGWLLPLWFLQGTFFWALFVIGHDCGHGAFSRNVRLCRVVGHALHTPLLVPFHGWRASHRLHHARAGNVEQDEGWFPLTETQWRALPASVRGLRSWLLLLVFPLYLLRRTPERAGSHFDPDADLFTDADRPGVRTSARLCAAMAVGLVAAGIAFGPWAVIKYWGVPYLVFCGWLDLVTLLHHTDVRLPWFRGAEWSWLRGALSTADRRYGLFERLHHDAGCHVVHHLFPAIPHYHLREAAAAVRPVLGAAYHEAREPILHAFVSALRDCQVVPETGGVVHYERRSGRRAPNPVSSDASARPSSGAAASPITT